MTTEHSQNSRESRSPVADEADSGTDRELLGWSLGFVRPHLTLVFLGALILPTLAATRVAGPYILKVAIDGPIRAGEPDEIAWLALAFLGVVLLQGLLDLAKRWVMELLGQRITTDLRASLFERVTRLNMSYFDREPMGKILTRLTSDIEALNEFLSTGFVDIVADGVLLIGILAVMISLDPVLALTSVVLMPLLLIFVAVARKLIRGIFSRLSEKKARQTSFAQEVLSGLTVVQAFRREQASRERYERLGEDALTEDLRGVTWSSQISAVVELASWLSIGLMFLISADRGVTLGVLVAFVQYIGQFYRPVENLSGRFATLQKSLASAEKIHRVFLDSERFSDPAGETPAPKLERGIRFRDVRFSYKPGTEVLRGLSFEVKRGQTVALVGATGAGKSSLVKLIGRFYEPDSGEILWDDRPLSELQVQSLRGRFGNVPQETFLFSDTLEANIGLGRVSREDVEAAASAVRADRVAADLPGGYDQVVGEQGRDLSAGERQLIAFARALARDPDLLVLDEATASIDGETEQVIQDALRTLLADRTALVIAHRLSTIREADKILVLHRGELREEGTHDELIAQQGLYYKLYRLQSVRTGDASAS